jgi:transcriptional regulator with XRE-family HTH domain
MYEEKFPLRLAQLRGQKGVSARAMSLDIGQNEGYINNIESGKALPSMAGFFYICEYLGIEPKDFLDFDTEAPNKLAELLPYLKKLNNDQLNSILTIVKDLAK